MSIGLAIFLPILIVAIASQFRRPDKPTDWTAERHRTITRNGFKARMGVK